MADKQQPKKPGRQPATFMISMPFEEAVKAATEVEPDAVRKKARPKSKKKRR